MNNTHNNPVHILPELLYLIYCGNRTTTAIQNDKKAKKAAYMRAYRKRKRLYCGNNTTTQNDKARQAARMRDYRKKQGILKNGGEIIHRPTADKTAAEHVKEYRSHKKQNLQIEPSTSIAVNMDTSNIKIETDSEFFPASFTKENIINIGVNNSIPVIKTEFSDNGLEEDPLHVKEEVSIPFVKAEIPSDNVQEKCVININEEPALSDVHLQDNSNVNDKLMCIKKDDDTLFTTKCETKCKLESVRTEHDADGEGKLHEMDFSEQKNSSISGLTYPSEKSDVKDDLCSFASIKIEMKNDIIEEERELKEEESWLSCQDDGRQSYCAEADVLNAEYNIANSNVSAVGTHISYLRSQKRFACEFCGYRACTKSRLMEHARKHTGEMPYECNICTKRFKRKVSVTYHMHMHRNPKKLLDESTTFKCLVCMKIFPRNAHLLKHMKTHEEKEYECDMCDKKFSMLSSLAIHKLKHNLVEKLYECNMCKKFFSSPGNLSDHSVIHSTEEKPSTYQFQFINYVGSTAE